MERKTWLVQLVLGVMLAMVVGGCGEDTEEPDEPLDPQPFGTTAEHLTVKVDGEYQPLFIKAINLGVAIPGTMAGELAATRQDYDRWLEMIGELGFNAVRVYTLHYPRFYEALDDYNRANPDDPIYVLHGIWLDEEEWGAATQDLFELTDDFRDNIREVVDCVHGNCTIDERFGRAFGNFETNISRWLLGWVIGREVHPHEVVETNEEHSEQRSFDGEAFRIDDADPVEVWWARKLELLVGYEREEYGVERPVSVSSWPTLDPIDHPTERSEFSDEELASVDLTQIEKVDAPAGLFATYHAYPYYPDYIIDDPDYREYADEEGPNSYKGYLFRLNDHYEEMPLFVGETGVPSSWGSAHWGYEDMDHGGHTEREQGEVAARLMNTVYATETAGGAFFAWIDEWWKPTWITDPFDYPMDRRTLWHNITAPEQNFGLVAFEPEPSTSETLDVHDRDAVLQEVEAAADAAYFRVTLQLSRELQEEDQLVVGFDTVGDGRGESQLVEAEVTTDNGNEFALVVDDEEAWLYVTEAYDLVGYHFFTSDEAQVYRSVGTDGEPWNLMMWQNGAARESDDGQWQFDATYHDVGRLRVREDDEDKSSHDAVIIDDNTVEIRIPWTFLHVVDPGEHRVVQDDRVTHFEIGERQRRAATTTTDGIAVSVALNEQLRGETDRFLWDGWDEVPQTTERLKEGAEVFSEALDELPYWVE